MANSAHPFHAVGALAVQRGMDRVALKVERDGEYVRLVCDTPPVFFKYRPDPSDSFDRANLDQHKRILLSQEDCAEGPQETLVLIEQLLEKFAGYASERPAKKPKSGRDK